MGALDLPDPVVRHPVGGSPVDTVALAEALPERVEGEVRFDGGSRAAYSTDASNFRQTPIGVVVPRTPEAAVEAVAVAPRARGAGAVAVRWDEPGRAVHQHRRGDRLVEVLRPAGVRGHRRPYLCRAARHRPG